MPIPIAAMGRRTTIHQGDSHGRKDSSRQERLRVVPKEIDVQSPNIKGLYFGGDSIRSIGTPMSDKCFQLAFPIRERVLDYLRKGRD
jgi:hypothetical protein